jgi:hypothetical protein
MAARITLASCLLALVGPVLDESLEAIGWSLAASSLIAWIGITLVARYLTPRCRIRTTE